MNLQFVDAYRTERAEKDAHPKTVFTEVVIIRQIVNFGLSRELLSQDPLKRLKLKKVKPSPQPCWTRHEVEIILKQSNNQYRPLLQVLADTGMRIGELKHLTWQDVDFQAGVLRIRAKEGWKPKTGDERAVPITQKIQSMLSSMTPSTGWVFTSPVSARYPAVGRPISERRLLEHVKKVLKKVGLQGHLHTFQHAFISHALISGIPEAIVRSWVGHVDAQIMKTYTHIADQTSKEAMQRLSETNESKQKAHD